MTLKRVACKILVMALIQVFIHTIISLSSSLWDRGGKCGADTGFTTLGKIERCLSDNTKLNERTNGHRGMNYACMSRHPSPEVILLGGNI